MLSEAQQLARDVDDALENFDTQRAGRLLSAFVDALSNWYVRRSRRRFWEGDPAALATLHEALRTVTLCLAPFTPFITERVWQDLFRSTDRAAPGVGAPRGLAAVDADLVDEALTEQMALVRRLVELGRGLARHVVGAHPPAAASRPHLGRRLGARCRSTCASTSPTS